MTRLAFAVGDSHNGKFPWGEMWVDENGQLKRLPGNMEATRIALNTFPSAVTLVGNVICRVRKGRELP